MFKVKVKSEGANLRGMASPRDIVEAVRAGVADILMSKGAKGSFSIQGKTSDNVGYDIAGKAIASNNDGRFMYHLSGTITVGGMVLKVNGNAPLPKSPSLTLDDDSLAVYKVAKKANLGKELLTADEQALLDDVSEDTGDNMDQGESTIANAK